MAENKSYEEYTLNFRIEDSVPIVQREMNIYNYEFVGNKTTCQETLIDDVRALQYRIPATLPLEQFLKKQLYKPEFLSILSNILNQLMYFEENEMSLNKLLLNIHYMYIDLSTMDIQLIYMPIEKKFGDCNVTDFVQKFISNVRFANMECVECVEQITSYLNSKLMFDLKDFYSYIISLEQAVILEDVKNEEDVEKSKTSVLSVDSSDYSNPIPYLVRIKTNELISIIKTEFLVGKSPDADYQITDNRKVSRKHAFFRISNGECYIRDNNSTNHTFVNGKLLQPGIEVMLHNNDYIRLGDEEFKYWVK